MRPRHHALATAVAVALLAPGTAHADYYGPSGDEVAGLIAVILASAALGVSDMALVGYDSAQAANHDLSGSGYCVFEGIYGGAQAGLLAAITARTALADLPDSAFGILAAGSLPLGVAMHGLWARTSAYDGFPYAMLPVAAVDASVLAYGVVRIGERQRPTALNGFLELVGSAPQLAFGIAEAAGGRRQDVGLTLGFTALPALMLVHAVWAFTGEPSAWTEATARRDGDGRVAWSIAPMAGPGQTAGVAAIGAF